MTQDVFSQLSRRITEAEHRSDLWPILRDMWHRSRKGELSNEEFNKLAAEESQRRMAMNEQVNRRNQIAYRRGVGEDFEYERLTAAAAQRLAGTTVTNRCPRCKTQLVFDAEPREHETAAYLVCPDECGYAGERIA